MPPLKINIAIKILKFPNLSLDPIFFLLLNHAYISNCD